MTGRPFCGTYLKTSDWLTDQGADETIRFYNRAADAGYPDILAWDNMHARPQPQQDYPEAAALQAAVKARGGFIIVQCAYFGQMLADYIGDGRVLESGSDQQGDRFACLADPRVIPTWEEQAHRLDRWWPDAVGVMLSYDEYRIQGTHEKTCGAYSGRFGSLLASHAKAAIAMHRAVNPNWRITLWSDMFDPHENAGDGDYYNVRGGWSGSWEGIDSECLIVNWNTKGDETCEPGFRHFAGLGCPQLFAGYYDGPGGDGISASDERQVLSGALDWAGGKLAGYVYTTWENNYNHLRDYHPGDLLTRMASFPAGGTVTPPTPDPVPVPPPPPDPLAADLSEMDGLIERVQTRGVRAKQRTVFGRIKAEIAGK